MMGDKDAAAERLRTSVMTAGAALTFCLGALASGAVRAGRRRYSPATSCCKVPICSGPDAPGCHRTRGKQRDAVSTVRAFLIYIAAFVLVLYLGWMGVWRAWLEPAIAELAIIVALTGGLGWFLLRRPRPARDISVADSPTMLAPAKTWPRPAHLRLSPSYHCSPLWDHERGSAEDPADLGLSESLVERIRAWDAAFQATYSEDDPLGSIFASVEEERAWTREGDAIAAELEREWPGALTIEISGARHAGGGLPHRPATLGQGACGDRPMDRRALRYCRDRSGDRPSRQALARQGCAAEVGRRHPGRHRRSAGLLAANPGTGALPDTSKTSPRGWIAPKTTPAPMLPWRWRGHDRDAALPLLRSALAREEAELVRVILAAAIAQAESTAIPHGQDERKDG